MKTPINFSFANIKKALLPKEKIKNFFWFLGNHIFFVILLFILIDILFGGLLFYKYVILAEKQSLNIQDDSFRFEESMYQDVLKKMQAREEKFKESSITIYSTPF